MRNRATLGLILVLSACGRTEAPKEAPPKPTPVADVVPPLSPEVGSALADWLANPGADFDPTAQERTVLATIYPLESEAPLWLQGPHRPSGSAAAALTLLTDAAAEGLDPADYRAAELATLGRGLESGSLKARDAAAFDISLSLSMMRYLRHFHRGRVDPRAIGFLISLPSDEHDYAALVRDCARPYGLNATLTAMTPPLAQYRALRSMLPRYRALALTEGHTFPRLPEPPRKSIKPGDSAAALNIVRTRLMALGDLPPDAPTLLDPPVYEGELVEGVKRFQLRHGYENDGVLGRATWTAMNVPIPWRVRQLEMAMERMRWLPHLGARPFLAVNIPMFRLWGWDSVPEDGAPTFDMGVVVGKALNTETPVFMEEMRFLIFQPYWNVPRSILQQEILPAIRRNPGYLAKQDMEIVDGQGDDARRVEASPANVDLLARGKLRLRQRPGPKNALGQVKFIFPNDDNIYLHSTPAPQLFGRARRDFSHGCVRVEDPVSLAAWLLKDQPEWTRAKIAAAMKGDPSVRVNLKSPLRVVLYYVTATVIPAERAVHFADDIYDQDPRLDSALRKVRKTS